jgi:hypothetical protein
VCTPSRPAANTRRRSEISGCPLLSPLLADIVAKVPNCSAPIFLL